MFQFGLSLVICALAFWIGMKILRMMAQPVPEPLPEGEMRRVNLKFRCSNCGAELKMTHASAEAPEPPRHCMEDMEPLAPSEF